MLGGRTSSFIRMIHSKLGTVCVSSASTRLPNAAASLPNTLFPSTTSTLVTSPHSQRRTMYNYKGVTLAGRPMYLDAQSTTPLDPRVLDAMLPTMVENFGNAHSTTHMYGWENADLTENARKQVADLIHARPKEIIFTSGATEANNLAIKGVTQFYKKKPVVVTTAIEHKCVLDSCRKISTDGNKIVYLPVEKNGIVDLKVLENALEKHIGETALVSIMLVNNEIGVIQPVKQIGELCRKYKTFFHTDGAQALGKIPIDVDEMNIDLMSLSGHKIYGPKGIGCLFTRTKPRVKMVPMISGGGQERGLRSGTLPVSLVIGFGAACDVASREMESDAVHARKLYDIMYKKITEKLDYVYLNGDMEKRWHGNLNLSFAYVEGESLLMGLKDVACSSGSACTSSSLEPSYVLKALGVDDELAHTSIRIGIGRFTTEEEAHHAVDHIIEKVEKLREVSCLYDLVKEGVDLKSIEWSEH